MARREFAGAAPATTLTSSMTAGSPTSGQTFTVASGTGYPTGSTGSFVVKVDSGTASAEKILCSARSGNTFTVATSGRGYDSTTAVSHGGGVTTGTVEHCIDSVMLTDLMRHVYDNTHDDHTQYQKESTVPFDMIIACSDETTAITTGNAKVTFRMPFAATVTAVAASLTTASTSGIPTIDINESGTTILSTKLTIDANELTSATAATAPVISDASIAADAEMTIDFDVAGTGAKGVKVRISGTRSVSS